MLEELVQIVVHFTQYKFIKFGKVSLGKVSHYLIKTLNYECRLNDQIGCPASFAVGIYQSWRIRHVAFEVEIVRIKFSELVRT